MVADYAGRKAQGTSGAKGLNPGKRKTAFGIFHAAGSFSCSPNRQEKTPVPLGMEKKPISQKTWSHMDNVAPPGRTSCRNCTNANRTQFESPEGDLRSKACGYDFVPRKPRARRGVRGSLSGEHERKTPFVIRKAKDRIYGIPPTPEPHPSDDDIWEGRCSFSGWQARERPVFHGR